MSIQFFIFDKENWGSSDTYLYICFPVFLWRDSKEFILSFDTIDYWCFRTHLLFFFFLYTFLSVDMHILYCTLMEQKWQNQHYFKHQCTITQMMTVTLWTSTWAFRFPIHNNLSLLCLFALENQAHCVWLRTCMCMYIYVPMNTIVWSGEMRLI